jgi:hypothetical protein
MGRCPANDAEDFNKDFTKDFKDFVELHSHAEQMPTAFGHPPAPCSRYLRHQLTQV